MPLLRFGSENRAGAPVPFTGPEASTGVHCPAIDENPTLVPSAKLLFNGAPLGTMKKPTAVAPGGISYEL